MGDTIKACGSDQYHAFMTRLLRTYGRRATEGQLDTESLRQLAELRVMLDEQTAEVVRALRSEQGGSHSWAEIGDAVGLTRAAALRRFGAAESDARRVGGQPSRLR